MLRQNNVSRLLKYGRFSFSSNSVGFLTIGILKSDGKVPLERRVFLMSFRTVSIAFEYFGTG